MNTPHSPICGEFFFILVIIFYNSFNSGKSKLTDVTFEKMVKNHFISFANQKQCL